MWMLQIAARLLFQLIGIMHWFMVAVGSNPSDTTESATKTALGLYSTTTDLRDVSTKSAISQLNWIFLYTVRGTGQFASSARTTITILTGCWFVDRTV